MIIIDNHVREYTFDRICCFSTWKEPFLYRSACFQVVKSKKTKIQFFLCCLMIPNTAPCSILTGNIHQALHTAYQETCGDSQDTIAKDREEADIIGDGDCKELERLFFHADSCWNCASIAFMRPVWSFSYVPPIVGPRQHCRLSICEYWLSWTNIASEAKIQITLLILTLSKVNVPCKRG